MRWLAYWAPSTSPIQKMLQTQLETPDICKKRDVDGPNMCLCASLVCSWHPSWLRRLGHCLLGSYLISRHSSFLAGEPKPSSRPTNPTVPNPISGREKILFMYLSSWSTDNSRRRGWVVGGEMQWNLISLFHWHPLDYVDCALPLDQYISRTKHMSP